MHKINLPNNKQNWLTTTYFQHLMVEYNHMRWIILICPLFIQYILLEWLLKPSSKLTNILKLPSPVWKTRGIKWFFIPLLHWPNQSKFPFWTQQTVHGGLNPTHLTQLFVGMTIQLSKIAVGICFLHLFFTQGKTSGPDSKQKLNFWWIAASLVALWLLASLESWSMKTTFRLWKTWIVHLFQLHMNGQPLAQGPLWKWHHLL